MKSYYITVPLIAVTGTVTYLVEAKNKKEAMAKLKKKDVVSETSRDIEGYQGDMNDPLCVEES